MTDSLIIGFDFTDGEDTTILIVGKHKNSKMEIVNAFQGQEASELYEKLTTVKKEKKYGI